MMKAGMTGPTNKVFPELSSTAQNVTTPGTEFEYAELENVFHFSGYRLMTALLIHLLVFNLIFHPRGVRSPEYADI